MEAVKKQCKDRTGFEEVRDLYNIWIGKMWDVPAGGTRNWFDDTNEKLRCAFVRTVSAPRPRVPTRPRPLVGTDRDTLGAELLQLCALLLQYGFTLYEYSGVIHLASGLTCRNQTGGFRQAMRNSLRLNETMPPVRGDHKQLCRNVTLWAKQFHRSTEAFATWEDRMDRCLNNRDPNCPPRPTEKGTAAIMQVSPVPWPPWEDYADE